MGARLASRDGLKVAESLSAELAAAGLCVVSGLARGIDTAAHRGALRNGRSIAVLGSGLAEIYPRENKELAQSLAENGALISEFPMKTGPDKPHFPLRNRIVAGLTLGTLLVEGLLKSGAMITIRKALSYQRQVFALSGDLNEGIRQLLASGQAQLIKNAQEIIGWVGARKDCANR